MKSNIRNTCLALIPALVGIILIFFTILNAFNENAGIYKQLSWIFFWVFLGLVLVSHSIISFILIYRKNKYKFNSK
jgi:hypothetical protein